MDDQVLASGGPAGGSGRGVGLIAGRVAAPRARLVAERIGGGLLIAAGAGIARLERE